MNYEEKFKEETGFNAYEDNNLRPKVPRDYYVEWLEEQLRIAVVSGRSEQLCSCSSKILPNGNIQFSLCRKCQEEMNEHN